MDLKTLRIANTDRQREWDGGNRIDLAFRAIELAGECGEACNIIKKLIRRKLGLRGSQASVSDLADELADIVICVDLIAMGEGIDLSEAIRRKFNLTSDNNGLTVKL